MRLLILLLISFNVWGIDYFRDNAISDNFLYSFDADGNQIIQNTTSGWFHVSDKDNPILKQDFGIGYTHSWYLNDKYLQEYNFNGSAVSLLANYKYEDFSIIGSAGIGQMSNRSSPYFMGDMNFNYQYNNNTTLSFELYGDLVNSTNAMIEGIAFTGYAFTVDYYNNYGGIAASVGQMFYSDANIRTVGNLKIYADVYDGINVYFRTKQYGNTDPYNGLYFNPEMYSRYGLGVGFRQRYEDIIFSGMAEGGAITASNEWFQAIAWRLNVENAPNKYNWTTGLTFGSDIQGSNNYQYYFLMANFKYSF